MRVLRWFGHVVSIYALKARRVLMAEASSGTKVWLDRLVRWMVDGLVDGVKVALGRRGMTVEAQ